MYCCCSFVSQTKNGSQRPFAFSQRGISYEKGISFEQLPWGNKDLSILTCFGPHIYCPENDSTRRKPFPRETHTKKTRLRFYTSADWTRTNTQKKTYEGWSHFPSFYYFLLPFPIFSLPPFSLPRKKRCTCEWLRRFFSLSCIFPRV